jgi:hypothetical protein
VGEGGEQGIQEEEIRIQEKDEKWKTDAVNLKKRKKGIS